MFATIAQQRMDARAEYQQGEEQSRLRERLRTDYELKDFILIEVENDDTSKLLEEIITSTVAKFNAFKIELAQLQAKKKERNTNYHAINADIIETQRSFANYIDDCFDANLNGNELDALKNKMIEKAINNDYPITKE